MDNGGGVEEGGVEDSMGWRRSEGGKSGGVDDWRRSKGDEERSSEKAEEVYIEERSRS
jgi:hypothetical protein